MSDKFKEALIWLRNNNGKVTFSRDAEGNSLSFIEVEGVKSCCSKFFEALEKVKSKLDKS